MITGKQRASRIPLDFYKHPDRLVRTKLYLTWGAGILTVVWLITAFIPTGANSPLGDNRFSHGPVALAHQPIDSDCAACHVDFAVFASGKPFKGDKKCQTCHLEDDLAVHHGSQKVDMTPNCGKCHSDHHDRDWNLNRVADRDCTTCHKDIKDSMVEGNPRYDKVTSFASEHPEFRDLKNGDPGKLKFNHKYHMTPGIVLTKEQTSFKVEDMQPGPQRDEIMRTQKLGLKDAVKLECASCHQPDVRDDVDKGDRPNPVENRAGWEQSVQDYYRRKQQQRGSANHNLLPLKKTGTYMAPIHYEKHCAACHSLSFDPDFPQQRAPHRVQPDKLKTELTRFYKENAKNLVAPLRTSLLPLPGKHFGGLTARPLEERVESALRSLLSNRVCGECHLAKDDLPVTPYTEEIVKPNIPEIWLKHARFDHSAHTSRGISCKECHAAAYPTTEQDLDRGLQMKRQGAEVVMIGNLKECRQCHTPKPEPKFADAGLQAKFDCTECHTYHNGPVGMKK